MAVRRPRMHVRPVLEQYPYNACMAFGSGPHERRLAETLFFCVDGAAPRR
jgi:hypothetical protein